MLGGSDTPPDKHRRFEISGEKQCLKPKDSFWTSTAIQTPDDGYTSSWVEWCKLEMPEYVSSKGFLFRAKPQAKILTIRNDIEAEAVYRKHLGRDPDSNLAWERALYIIRHFPWRLIASQYDAVHYDPDYSEEDMPLIMRAWDCESTVWFDMNAIELIQSVNIT